MSETLASGHRRLLAAACVLTLVGVVLVYLLGALNANPGAGFARNDLDILRNWKISGHLEDHPTDPAHLTKPGYILYLSLVFSSGGADPLEVRRFLILNAIWILLGIAVAGYALWRLSPSAALLFLLMSAFPPLRDSTDYVLTEPISAGLGLLFFGVLLGWGTRPVAQALLGLACAAILLLRPNLGWVLLAVALVVIAGMEKARRGLMVVVGSFLAAALALVVISRLTHFPANPFAVTTSSALLWGTADYYWPADIGAWPTGQTPRETAALQRAKARDRWIALFRQNSRDRSRALLWRLTHSLLSQEELPSRWSSSPYLLVDQLLRRWWWIGAIFLVVAAAAAAVAGQGAWRFVPALLVTASVAQGVAFGADPRFSLVFLPLLALGLVLAIPSVRNRHAVLWATPTTALLLLLAVHTAPDATASDYAVARGSGRLISQYVDPSQFPKGRSATMHLRVLKLPTFPIGLEVTTRGRLLFRREASDSSPYPPYLTIELADDLLDDARRSGLTLEIRTLGTTSAPEAFVHYPAVPTIFGGSSTIDGQRVLPSPYGDVTEGGIPMWLHGGRDPAAHPREKSSAKD